MTCYGAWIPHKHQDELSIAHGLTRLEDHGSKSSPAEHAGGHSYLTSDRKLASGFHQLKFLTLLDSEGKLVFCFTAYLRVLF
jgi:hypothetical protein